MRASPKSTDQASSHRHRPRPGQKSAAEAVDADRILDLQREVGNAAVVELIDRWRTPSINHGGAPVRRSAAPSLDVQARTRTDKAESGRRTPKGATPLTDAASTAAAASPLVDDGAPVALSLVSDEAAPGREGVNGDGGHGGDDVPADQGPPTEPVDRSANDEDPDAVDEIPTPPPSSSGAAPPNDVPTGPADVRFGPTVDRTVSREHFDTPGSTIRSGPVVQRQMTVQREDGPDLDLAAKRAIDAFNKNSVAITVPIKAPSGVRTVFKYFYVKEISGTVAATVKIKPPGPPKASESSLSPASLSATHAQGAVWAAQLKSAVGTSPLGEMCKFSLAGQSSAYAPLKAMDGSGRTFTGKLDVTLGGAATDKVGVDFTPLEYDPAKGALGWSLNECAVNVPAKDIVIPFTTPLTIGGRSLSAEITAKPSITVRIGVDSLAVGKVLAKDYPNEARALVKAGARDIATREAKAAKDTFIKKLVQEEMDRILADPKYADIIFDKGANELIRTRTHKAVSDAASAAGLDRTLVEAAEREILKLADAKPSSIVDLYDIATVRKAVGDQVTQFASRSRGSILKAAATGIGKAIKEFSLKKFAGRVAMELAGGPVDIVLIGFEILANYMDTLFKAQDIKKLELQTIAVRANYVSGYRAGMHGSAKGAAGTAGNIEGAALLLGQTHGAEQFDKSVQGQLKENDDFTLAEARAAVKTEMRGAPVAAGTIVKLGSPKLMEMMLAAYEKKYGEGFKGTKDYEHFARTIALVLSKNTQNRHQASLYIDGEPTGVVVTLIALDSVGAQRKKYRTLDGRYRVYFDVSGDKYSGWKTEDGTPLELIFTEPGHQSVDDEGYQNAQMTKARQLSISLRGVYWGSTFAPASGSLGGLNESDLELREFMRTGAFQSMKLTEFASVSFSASQKWTAEFHDELGSDAWINFTAVVANGVASVSVNRATKYDDDKSQNADKVGAGGAAWKKDTGDQLAYWVSSRSMAQLPIQVG